jgi:hypothetical protein
MTLVIIYHSKYLGMGTILFNIHVLVEPYYLWNNIFNV